MNTIETIYASGRIVYLILVPFLRELAGVFLAIAISKDCKARDNGSGALWGVFTLITPLFAGVIYFIYSRLLVKRKGKTKDDKKKIKSSRKLTALAIFVYVLSVIVAIVAVITSLSSGIALAEKEGGGTNINSIMYDGYYDMNGVRYENGKDVILYDKNKNKYHYAESPNGFNYYTYFDEQGNEYDIELCYISNDGYFYYDKDNQLRESEDLFYYDKHFYDDSNNEYAHIDDYVFWDSEGNICIQYLGTKCRYAFQ